MKVGGNLICSNIKEIRQEKNLTISELAKKSGVAKSYLSTLEKNSQSNPSIGILIKVSKVLGVSVADLIESDD